MSYSFYFIIILNECYSYSVGFSQSSWLAISQLKVHCLCFHCRLCSKRLVWTKWTSNLAWRRCSSGQASLPSSTRSWSLIPNTWQSSSGKFRGGWSACDGARCSGVVSQWSSVSPSICDTGLFTMCSVCCSSYITLLC